MQRRAFVTHGGMAAILATGTAPAIAQSLPEIRWRLTSSFPKSLDTLWGRGRIRRQAGG
jgi:TRAP-type mannitol/chloroaromatic compound transport system substrate-binding protein